MRRQKNSNKNKKAQAGLDFLMTYGWALLLIVLVVGALFALGIFNPNAFLGNKAAGFAQVGVVGYKVDSAGVFSVKLRNQAGTQINITSMNATLGSQTLNYGTTTQIDNGKQSGTITVGTFGSPPASGSSYSVAMQIGYTDTSTGFAYTNTGTVTGTVG